MHLSWFHDITVSATQVHQIHKETGIMFLNTNPYCVWKGKGMHAYTSSFWGMQVDDLRLMLNRKWTEIYEGILHFIIFSQNHSLNLHVVATCWTISACTVNNISIISFIKKKTLLDDHAKHIMV